MASLSPTTKWATRSLFSDAPAGDRLHVAARCLTAPLDAVVESVPPGGRTLDFGCGHGLVSLTLGLNHPVGDVEGVDVDGSKIRCASKAAELGELAHRVRFNTIDSEWTPRPAGYDNVVVCDVLYLLGHRAARLMLGNLAAAVRPGGQLVIKEMSETPRWKNWLDRSQEHLAVRIFGYTSGDQVEPLSVERIAQQLRTDGWSTRIRRLDRRDPHPHALVIGTAPPGHGA